MDESRDMSSKRFRAEKEEQPLVSADNAETPREPIVNQGDIETPRYNSSGSSSTKPSQKEFSKWEVPTSKYRLVRILGSGSYGDVAEAVDLSNSRTVAIKRIHNVFDQPIDTKRIIREVNILRQLKDVRIIKLLNILPPVDLENFNELYLVFEFMKTDLAKLIGGPQYLRIQHIQFLLYQLLCALKYMHSGCVVHRDLKPANILLNDDCTLKVCDFGLARILNHQQSEAPAVDAADLGALKPLQRQLTKHVVTRWYRSPEIILYQQYSTPVDVWSAGCIFAELLSMQKTSVSHYTDRMPLFPGKTCFPLSCDNDRTYKDQLDQLNVIFDVIGTPLKEDVAHLAEVSTYLCALPKKEAKNLQDSFPGASKEAIDLLTRMFAFNPEKRITVNEALEHPFFASIRQKNCENELREPIASFEENDSKVLRQRLIDEINLFHVDTLSRVKKEEI